MKSLQKITNKILILSSIFLVVVVAVFCFFYNQSEPKQFVCATKSIPICGTKNLSSKAQEGKQLFNSICAACHKLDSKSIGPALRNTDSIVFQKWLSHQKFKIDTTKIDKLKIDYHRNLSKENFTASDLKKIYAYVSGA